ncbi:MAG: copper-binding protein [Desulfarculales bacterium]|jgi:Cu/Ag efflux protein CusF|nr:copper-binding protein [Desulfarculales bacterium]
MKTNHYVKVIRIFALSAAVIGLFAGSGIIMAQHQHGGHDHAGMTSQAAPGGNYTASGVVKAVGKDRLTIEHEPIPGLNLPAMVMDFLVTDDSLLQGIEEGDAVSFVCLQQGRNYFILDIEPVD